MYRIWNLLLSLNLQSQLDYVLEMINSYGWLCEINNQTVISISWECFGEGNGKPLQYSYLENPMDGGALRLQPIGGAMSWIQLSDFTFTFHFHTLEKEMATHSSVLAWRIPGMAEPGRLPSMGSHRVGHDWSDLAAAAAESVLLQKDLILFIWILVIQSLSRVGFLMTPWNAACQASLSFTISWSLLNSTRASIFFPLKWECTAIYWTLKTLLLQFFVWEQEFLTI